ncbi:MAG: hypothetical protein LBC71_01795 [Oscillospiraceae bacterium]|nr:hypothetical protein [Oscillospiraceae bacterium]
MKYYTFTLLFILILLTSCKHTDAENSPTSNPMHDLFPNANMTWMARLDVQMPTQDLYIHEVYNIWEFEYEGGEIAANVIFENGLDGTATMGLMIFSDGVPIQFTVDGYNEQTMFYTLSVEGLVIIPVRFTPEFSFTTGTLDFIQFHNIYNNGVQHHSGSMRIIADVQEALLHERYMPTFATTPARNSLGLASDTSYDSWLWQPDFDFSMHGTPGWTTITIGDTNSLLFEAITGLEGIYRTTIFIDYKAIPVDDDYYTFEWITDGENVLTFLLNIDDSLIYDKHTIFSVSFRIGGYEDVPPWVQNVAFVSRKMELVD